MRIKTALILCAGLGKRLNPLTLKIPKPLLEINNLTLLENTINLIKSEFSKKSTELNEHNINFENILKEAISILENNDSKFG